MKILTNVYFNKVAGIAQALSSFIDFVEKSKLKIKVVGVDIVQKGQRYDPPQKAYDGNFSLISATLDFEGIATVINGAKTLKDVKKAYQSVIDTYASILQREKPDLVLINGTYFLPWCLLLAARQTKTPVALHYHGILSKETSHWEEKPRQLFQEMERTFDGKDVYYIFPSQLAKETVEQEVYGHAVKRFSVLPNPVPLHFFKVKPQGQKRNVGVVGRWTRIKNPKFVEGLARHNFRKIDPRDMFVLNVLTDLKRNSKPRQRLGALMRFKNPLENTQLGTFYAQMGIVLSPSFFETYGNVAQEALASGIPVLVSKNMGVAETFRNLGLDDWIVDFSSIKNVNKLIRQVSGKKVTRTVRKKLRDQYNPELLHAKLLAVLKTAYN
ncbi:MAG: glycosyltransferase family 4 protein [Candidatus Yanofskybacteria bacterium]|nr:glycosyltransferase family 4 protein [Candidatus Yanofskybacteria bacterium]